MTSKRAWAFRTLSAAVLAGGLGLAGCMPENFIQTTEAGWCSVEIGNLSYDDAWNRCVDVVARKFDLDAPLSKDSGYLRTCWMYNWTGAPTPTYRVRATLKFSPDRKTVDIKTEAECASGGRWVAGTDTRLTETMKSDIMGVVSRTTR